MSFSKAQSSNTDKLISETNNKLKQGFHNLCCKLDTHIFDGCLECQNSFKYLISGAGLGYDIPFGGHSGDFFFKKGCADSATSDTLKDFYFVDQHNSRYDLTSLLNVGVGTLPFIVPAPSSGGDFSVYVHFISTLGLHVILELRYTYDSINNAWLVDTKLTSNSTTSQQGADSNEVLYNIKIKKIHYTTGNNPISYIDTFTGDTISLNTGETLALNCTETFK